MTQSNLHYLYYNHNKIGDLGTNCYCQSKDDKVLMGIKITAVMIALMIMGKLVSNGIDKSIENQDRMLCESARISGNLDYLKKCQCYYANKNISCLRGKGGE